MKWTTREETIRIRQARSKETPLLLSVSSNNERCARAWISECVSVLFMCNVRNIRKIKCTSACSLQHIAYDVEWLLLFFFLFFLSLFIPLQYYNVSSSRFFSILLCLRVNHFQNRIQCFFFLHISHEVEYARVVVQCTRARSIRPTDTKNHVYMIIICSYMEN